MAAGLVSLGKHACGWVNNACEKGEQLQHVLNLFEKMRWTCGWVNNACETGEQWQHVLDLFEKMQCESVQRVGLTYSAAISASILDNTWYVIIINGIRR